MSGSGTWFGLETKVSWLLGWLAVWLVAVPFTYGVWIGEDEEEKGEECVGKVEESGRDKGGRMERGGSVWIE